MALVSPKVRGEGSFTAIAAVLFLLLSVGVASAQSSRGTVTGLAIDSTKSAVGKAKVDLINDQTKIDRSTTTNDAGVYRFDAVDPGTYTLKVTAQGFRVGHR